ncbi:MAG: hypothetical protein WBA57_23640 [Elainellaceae cyanobacterium]
MRVLKKAIAGLMLLIGVPVCVLTILDIFNSEVSQEDKSNATAALTILGLPPVAIGVWLVGGLHTDARCQERDRLRTTFFNLVKQGQGKISVFDFAEAAQLSGDRARLYLDDRARTFNATFQVDDAGGMFYVFTLGYANAQRLLDNATPHPFENQPTENLQDDSEASDLETSDSEMSDRATDYPTDKNLAEIPANTSEEPTYDVLLKSVLGDRQTDIQQLLQTLTSHDAVSAAHLVKHPLSVVATGLNRATAEQYRHQLEAAGAAVLVVLPPAAEVSEVSSAIASSPEDAPSPS